MQSGRQLTKIRKIIESWGLEVPKETAGKRLVAKIYIFAAVFECQLGGAWRGKGELNEERSDKDEESDEHCSFSVLVGVRKVGFLTQHALVRLSKMCFPPRAGSIFSKKYEK